jgi:hypothetical protein
MGHDLAGREPPATAESHQALPVRGTFRHADSGEPLNSPTTGKDYPVAARCVCGSTIRKPELFGKWQHTE